MDRRHLYGDRDRWVAATGTDLREEEALDALTRRWHEWSQHAKDVGVQTRSHRRRYEFLRTCPDLVIVDEVHTCVAAPGLSGSGRTQRYDLVRELADDPRRQTAHLTGSRTSRHRPVLGKSASTGD